MFAPRQPSLFGHAELQFDGSFAGVRRSELTAGAWVDYGVRWLAGDEELFETIEEQASWERPVQRMYDKIVQTPRLTARIDIGVHPILQDMVDALSDRYRVRLDRISAGLYRDGRDSVAWHGDRIARDLPEATVATVSLVGPRRFLLRPVEGGESIGFTLGHGDLVVMGGTCQRTWQHSVPKVAAAPPRIALMFRHAYPQQRG